MAKNTLDTALTIHAGVKGINELKRLSDEIKNTGTNTKYLDDMTDELQKSWDNLSPDEQTKKVKELAHEFKSLKAISDAKITLGIDDDHKAKKQLEEVNKAFEQLKLSGKLTQSELARASQLHTQKVAELEKQLGKTTLNMQEMAGELGKIAGNAGGLAIVAKQAMDFETAMAGVKKVVNGTPEQMDALTTTIKDLSVELGMTAEEVANMAAMGGQLGVPIAELDKFTQMAGKMAVAFNMTADEAGNAAAKLANVFGIPILQVEKLGDAINTLGNNTAAKESEIVDAMLRIGGTAKQFGLAEEEAAALSAALIGLGKSPEVAATGINALLTKLQTAQTAGSDFQNALQSIGLSADEMADSIAKNPQTALSDFLGKLGELDDRQRSMVAVKLFGAEYTDDINALVGSLDTYKDALGLVADKTSTAGAMQKEFDAQMGTASKQVAQAKAELANLAITLGTHLLPIISSTVGAFGDMVGAIDEIANTYPTLTKIAVIIGSGMVAVRAFNSVLALTGGIGLKAGADIAKGFLGAELAIKSADIATDKLGKGLDVASGKAGKLEGAFGRLNQLMALMASYEIGNAIGDWAYENSSAVRSVGDEMGRVLAYLDAMVTDRTFADVNEHFKTSAESAKELANAQKEVKTKTDEMAEGSKQAKQDIQSQTQANIDLINSVKLSTAELELLEMQLLKMGMAGQKGTQEYQKVQEKVEGLKTKLSDLKSQAEQAGLGEALKSDVEKAKGAFEALGLDMDEFTTGIDGKTKQALSAFSEVATLAGDNVHQLALAYNAAKTSAGDNDQAQEQLNGRLLEAVNGNDELAEAVKRYAKEQKLAKNNADEHSKALVRLGLDIEATKARMSAGATQMVKDLSLVLPNLKEEFKNDAEGLKNALAQALDTSVQASQTQNDFKAIKQAIEQAGLASHLTAEQVKTLNTGMMGGSQAVKQALADEAKARQAVTQATDTQTKATTDNTTATQANATAKTELANATDKATQATEKQAQSETRVSSGTPYFVANMHNKILALDKLGASTEALNRVNSSLYDSLKGQTFGTIGEYVMAMGRVNAGIEKQIEGFKRTSAQVDDYTKRLSSASVSAEDLAIAQNVLANATSATINGIHVMDKARLDNLKAQIDSTKAKFHELDDVARSVADNLEGELARMQGNDKKALELENAQKLAELEKKLTEARQRGNAGEITQLERALNLQRQINQEKMRKMQESETQKAEQAKKEQEQRQTPSRQSTQNSNYDPSGLAREVADSWEKRIQEAEERGAKRGAEELMKRLASEGKRRAN